MKNCDLVTLTNKKQKKEKRSKTMKKCIISMVLLLALFIIANCSKANDNVCSMFRGNLERNGLYNTYGPKKLPEIKWKFKPGGWETSPVVCNDVVYFDDSEYLYAIDTKTGQEQFKFKTDEGVESTPAVSEGMIYFGGDVNLYAVNIETSEKMWIFETDDDVMSSPALFDNILYFANCGDDNFYALDAKTGKEKWVFKPNDYNIGYSSPALSNGVVYFGGNYLYALDIKSGQEKWKF